MKTTSKILTLLLAFLFLAGCAQTESKAKQVTPKKTSRLTAENLKKIEVDIDGMTCEIGCARLIESKLSKTKGIKFVDVNFEKKLGQIEYDANTINPEKISEVVHNIAGGDLYRITAVKSVDKFSTIH